MSRSDVKVPVIDMLFDEEIYSQYFEYPLIFVTPHGCRIATKKRAQQGLTTEEYHRDQLLAALAINGVSLHQSIKCDSQNLQLRDLLNDCVAGFRLRWRYVAEFRDDFRFN